MIALLWPVCWKATLVLALAFAVARGLRRASANVRHAIWTAALAALLVLPGLVMVSRTAGVSVKLNALAATAPLANAIPASSIAEISSIVIWLWALGAIALALRLALGFAGAATLARRATPSDAACPVRVLESDAVSAPMTCGLFRPVILLPAAARSWRPAVLEHVLLHELAHARRRDAWTLLLANIVCCLYWFHPLVWLAARRLRAEAEHACDDSVLNAGLDAAGYADTLVNVARSLRPPAFFSPAATELCGRHQLEDRIMSILAASKNRAAATRATRLIIAACAIALLLPLVALQSQETTTNPVLLHRVEPQYTPEAKDARVEGRIVLLVEIREDGVPDNIEIKQPLDAGLDKNAVDAVRQWRFEPATRNGQPVAVKATIEINFRLK